MPSVTIAPVTSPPPLGLRIRRAREKLEWRQEDLAVAVGVSRNTIGNWERGEHVPRNRIGRLEEVLGVTLTGSNGHTPPDPATDFLRNAPPGLFSEAEIARMMAARRDLRRWPGNPAEDTSGEANAD